MSIPYLNINHTDFKTLTQNLIAGMPSEEKVEAKAFIVTGSYCLSNLTRAVLQKHLIEKADYSEENATMQIVATPQTEIVKIIKQAMSSSKIYTIEEITYQVCNSIIRYWNAL